MRDKTASPPHCVVVFSGLMSAQSHQEKGGGAAIIQARAVNEHCWFLGMSVFTTSTVAEAVSEDDTEGYTKGFWCDPSRWTSGDLAGYFWVELSE